MFDLTKVVFEACFIFSSIFNLSDFRKQFIVDLCTCVIKRFACIFSPDFWHL